RPHHFQRVCPNSYQHSTFHFTLKEIDESGEHSPPFHNGHEWHETKSQCSVVLSLSSTYNFLMPGINVGGRHWLGKLLGTPEF
ncbi:unnamed protein product, partial [Allacma fusca]